MTSWITKKEKPKSWITKKKKNWITKKKKSKNTLDEKDILIKILVVEKMLVNIKKLNLNQKMWQIFLEKEKTNIKS